MLLSKEAVNSIPLASVASWFLWGAITTGAIIYISWHRKSIIDQTHSQIKKMLNESEFCQNITTQLKDYLDELLKAMLRDDFVIY
mmetsp:Transcript_37119/g.42164  ORF Transcript_37119/g.42164 Transcript_37119/m.42164 type:complete len:85 (+) Transcript_37119:97-351(+)